MITTAPPPRPAAVSIGDRVCLPIMSTWPIASALADLSKFGRSRQLWLIRSTLADRFHFRRSCPLWSTRSTLTDQVHVGRSVQLWPIKSTLADQVHFGRSGPLWPTKSTLADQVHFGRSSPLGSGRLGRPISRPVLVMQECPIGSTLHLVYFSIQVRLASGSPSAPGSILADQVYFGRSGPI